MVDDVSRILSTPSAPADTRIHGEAGRIDATHPGTYFGYWSMKGPSLVALALVLIGCSAVPAPSSSSRHAASGAPSPSGRPQPSATESTSTETPELAVRSVDDPYAAGLMRVIELAGSPCISERHAEIDIANLDLELERRATAVGGDGLIPGAGVRAYIGSLPAAGKAFGATELLVRSGGRRAVAIGRATNVEGVADDASIAHVLLSLDLKDGRTVWVQVGDYIVSVPCSSGGS